MQGGGGNPAASATAWWQGLPIGTRLVFGLNAAVYLAGLCAPKNWDISAARAPQSFCMYPRIIWAHPSQWYRVFTSAFVHGGLMHIGFNMFNFVVSGPNLEFRIGTLRLLNLIGALVAVLGALYMAVASAGLLGQYPRFWNECAVGFSGVIFALITAESLTVAPDAQYNMWGVRIPARWYPWAMLAFTQLIMPNVSFIGHLVGILGAYLWHAGLLAPVLLPAALLSWIEDTLPLKIFRHPAWQRVAAADGSVAGWGGHTSGSATWMAACRRRCDAIGRRMCAPCSACWPSRARASGSDAGDADDRGDVEMGDHHPGGPRFFGSGTWGPSSAQAGSVCSSGVAARAGMPAAAGVAAGRGATRYEAVASKDTASPQQLPPQRRLGGAANVAPPPSQAPAIPAHRDHAGSDVHAQAGGRAQPASASATAHEIALLLRTRGEPVLGGASWHAGGFPPAPRAPAGNTALASAGQRAESYDARTGGLGNGGGGGGGGGEGGAGEASDSRVLPSHARYPLSAAFGGGAPVAGDLAWGGVARRPADVEVDEDTRLAREREAGLAAMGGVEVLVEMGFQREEALEGILIVGGDIGAAAELLASRRQQRLGPLRVLPG